MKFKIPEKIFPQAMLALLFVISLSAYMLVYFFPAVFYAIMDTPSYLVFHNVTEFFSVLVSLSIFGVGWFAFEQSKDRLALFLSCMFLGIGLMDFMHTLSYSGMPALITPNSPNKSTQFWIAVRMFSSLVFLISAFIKSDGPYRRLTKLNLLAFNIIISALVFAGIILFPQYMPATFIENVGLTPFKTYSEYFIILVLIITSAIYWKRFQENRNKSFLLYVAAFILCVFSELSFAGYKSVFDSYNVLGHIYKAAAFSLIYFGIFIVSVTRPYSELQNEISIRKKTEEALTAAKIKAEEAARAKSMFLANMSHELKTPMNGIIGFTNLLAASELDEEQLESVRMIKTSSLRLLEHINNLLDFSRLEVKKVTLDKKPFDIRAVMQSIIASVHQQMKKKNLELKYEIDPEMDYILAGDQLRYKQVLLNILTNAIKFSPSGTISIKVSQISKSGNISKVAVSISDEGIGISADKINEIFEMFHQLDESTTKSYGGTGLGISIVKGLVDLMNGAVSVKSEVGKGSCFTVEIPFELSSGAISTAALTL